MTAFLIKQCIEHSIQLTNDIHDPHSVLWKKFITELKEAKSIILPKPKNTRLMSCYVNLSKASFAKYCPLIRLVKYGDIQMYVELGLLIESEQNEKSVEFRRDLLGTIQLNISIMRLSLGPTQLYIMFVKNTLVSIIIPALNVLFLSEVIDGNYACERNRFQDEVEYAFMSFFLMNEHTPNDFCTIVPLGCLMMFANKYISRYLNNTSQRKMIRLMNDITSRLLQRDQNWQPCPFDAVSFTKLCSKIKKWRQNVFKMGKDMISTAISEEWTNSYCLILFGKCCDDSEKAFDAFTESIGRSTSMFSMTLSLRYLSRECVKNKQYVIALRLLNIAYKFCQMYELPITPLFVNEIYHRERAKIKKKLRKMKCSYCSKRKKGMRLKCCTACMKVAYCGVPCQTKHWKLEHKEKCDKEWLGYYRKLKDKLIFEDVNSL